MSQLEKQVRFLQYSREPLIFFRQNAASNHQQLSNNWNLVAPDRMNMSDQRRIQNSVKHPRWSVLRKQLMTFSS